MSFREELANRLRRLRENEGLSPEKMARIITNAGFDVSMSTVRNVESGSVKAIDVCYLQAFGRALRIPLAVLCGEALPPLMPAPYPREEELQRFAKILDAMTPAEIEPHLRALELLVQERQQTDRKKGKKKTG